MSISCNELILVYAGSKPRHGGAVGRRPSPQQSLLSGPAEIDISNLDSNVIEEDLEELFQVGCQISIFRHAGECH